MNEQKFGQKQINWNFKENFKMKKKRFVNNPFNLQSELLTKLSVNLKILQNCSTNILLVLRP